MKKRLRIVYAGITLTIFICEVYIALFVRDDFIRPYFGDVLVTVLLCCFARAFFPLADNYSIKTKAVWAVPVSIFLFSVFIEFCQYFNYVERLGLGNIEFFRIVMGTGFALKDIWCYASGCIAFFVIEYFVRRKRKI